MKVSFFVGSDKTINALTLIVALMKGAVVWILFIYCESSPMMNEFHVLYWPLM